MATQVKRDALKKLKKSINWLIIVVSCDGLAPLNRIPYVWNTDSRMLGTGHATARKKLKKLGTSFSFPVLMITGHSPVDFDSQQNVGKALNYCNS